MEGISTSLDFTGFEVNQAFLLRFQMLLSQQRELTFTQEQKDQASVFVLCTSRRSGAAALSTRVMASSQESNGRSEAWAAGTHPDVLAGLSAWGSLRGACAAELKRWGYKAGPSVHCSLRGLCYSLVLFSCLISWSITWSLCPYPGVFLPASACSRSQPCRGPRQRTASCATDTRGGSAQPSSPPLTKSCPIRW